MNDFGFMGLDKSCETFLNKTVLVKPVYGWGWSRLDAPEIRVPSEINGVPRPFNCLIKEFSYFQNKLNGAIGIIKEENHIYNGLWTFFYPRVERMVNFTNEIGYYNLEIGPQMPEFPVGKDWLEFTSGSPIVNGYAFVAESLQRIEKYDERQIEKWEIMRDAMNDNG